MNTVWILALITSIAIPCHAEIKQLRVVLANRPDALIPAQIVSQEGHVIVKHVFETLIVRSLNGTFRGGLAERWQFNQKQTELTIWLSPGRAFSNGEKVNAGDIESMIKTCLEKKINLSFQKIRSNGIKVVDARTVRLSFVHPNPEILNDLASVQASIVRSGSTEQLGTGPFFVVADRSTPENFELELSRNPHFNQRPVNVAHLTFTTAEKGGDVALTPASTLPQQLEFLTPQVDVLGFNLGSSSLRDLKIRKALAQELTANIVRDHFGELKYKVGGLIPLGLPGHTDEYLVPPFDPALRKLILKKRFKVFQYNAYTKELAGKYCEALNQAGAVCTLKRLEIPQLLKAHERNELEIVFARLAPSYPSVEDLLSLFSSASQINLFLGHAKDVKAEVNSQFKKLEAMPPDAAEARRDQAAKMDKLLIEKMVVKPFAYGAHKTIFYRKGLRIPNIGIMGFLDLDISSIEEDVK